MLGFAFANVSQLRRVNVIRHVAPSIKPLLKDPRAFSSREFDRLFGSKFIDVMVKEVEDNVSWQKSDAMAVPIPARVVAILIGAMATAIKTGVTAVITKMVASATEEKAEKTTRNLLSSSSRSGCLQQVCRVFLPFLFLGFSS